MGFEFTRRRAALIVVPLVLAVGGGTALAAGSGGDQIHACAGLAGVLRLADTCAKGETAVTWNVSGPQGPQGPQGPAGAAGVPGNVVGGNVLTTGDAVISASVDGVPSDTADGSIDVKAFDAGVKNSTTAGSGSGGGSGKAEFSTVKFAKLYDGASPKLLIDDATGTHIPTVTFTFKRPGNDGATFLTYTLTDVVVTSYEQGGTEQKPLLESVELSFRKIEVTYQPANGGSPVTVGWDTSTNSPA